MNGDEDGGWRFEENELDGHLVCVATNFKKSDEYQVNFFFYYILFFYIYIYIF